MQVAIVGAGGIGAYFGARLADAGAEVAFIARGQHLEALRERGLAIHSIHGDAHLDEVHATEDAADIGPCDVVLFCVKSYDTDAAARQHLPDLVGDDTMVVSLQNGVDNEERIAAVIGDGHVVGGLAFIFSVVTDPGVVSHTAGPARIIFGEMDGRRSDRVEHLLAWCAKAGIDAEVPPDIRRAIWDKFSFICAQSGTTAAVRLPIGAIRDTPETWTLFRRLVEETYAVARARGVTVGEGAVEERLAFAESLEPDTHSSLHHDLVTGHRMELEALHGTVVRLAREHGVDVPATTTIHAVLRPWARRNEGELDA
jgi:2-dehydropantoate 2-reductase